MTQLTKEDLVENFTNSIEKEEVCEKSEVASIFLKFKAAAESETGCKLKTLRFDNGTEYTSSGIHLFYDEAGIKHQLTNTYTLQKNGVSERKNKSLLDMARCLIFERNLPKTFWAEAVNTTVYLQNKLLTKALAQKTPFEAWFRFKPSLAHLRVFGCVCYAHVPVAKRDKLAKKAQPDAVSEDLATNQTEVDQNGPEIDIDDGPVRGTRPLAEIYERAHVAAIEPSCFEEAEAHQGWKQAMADEISIIEKNQTWQLVERPLKRKVIGVKLVFRAKHNIDGSLNKLKVRLVVKGFNQKYGIDYFETFAPMARLDTIRLLVALAAHMQ
ncbi:uncharacterized protein [Gossypium hirsutum]|uniref:Integrase catalytic domain-containing protein n=1 Tax=Gossypium hirsutum TaxID=3635 RepID=A0A1U8MFM9_GOSHI|nr:uncharacterized protein LOC107937300 [Gossypium hirsutum]